MYENNRVNEHCYSRLQSIVASYMSIFDIDREFVSNREIMRETRYS